MMEMVKRVVSNDKGQGMAEYGLILALVAIAVMGAFTAMSGGLNAILTSVGTTLTTAG